MPPSTGIDSLNIFSFMAHIKHFNIIYRDSLRKFHYYENGR